MSSKRAKAKTTKKRPQRATSNVFAMFDQSQIQEFKEAFNMIDQNRDGFIDKEDLHDMLASLGNKAVLSQMQFHCELAWLRGYECEL